MAPILGMIGTGEFQADEWPRDWRTSILRLMPNGGAPLTALLTALGIEGVKSPEYHWWEQGMPSLKVFINNGAGYGVGATSLVVDDGPGSDTQVAKRVRRGVVLLNKRTNEMMYVSSDPSSPYNTITVDRGVGTVAAAPIADNDELIMIGTANAENADAPTPIHRQETKRTNYTQIWRTSLGASRTAMHTETRNEPTLVKQRVSAMQEHFLTMERGYWFGQMSSRTDPVTGKPIRTTEGIRETIRQRQPSRVNSISGGALDLDTWEAHLIEVFKYGSSEKIAFCGNTALSVLTRLARIHSDLKMVPGDKTYGINLMEYTTPFGTLYLRNHTLFNEDADHSKTMAIIDPKFVRERQFLPMQLLQNIQPKGQDGRQDEFRGETGLETGLAETHYWLENVANPA